MHISRSVNVKIQFLMFSSLYISDVKHLCFWNIKPSYIRITIVGESAYVRYILYHKLLDFCLLGDIGVRSLSPNVNLVWSFLVVERGLNCYSMSLHQLYIPSIPKHRNKIYKNDYEQTYWHAKFHICIDVRAKCTFHIAFNC